MACRCLPKAHDNPKKRILKSFTVPLLPKPLLRPVAIRLVTRTEALSADRLEQHAGLA
jgi:hypothetical protein